MAASFRVRFQVEAVEQFRELEPEVRGRVREKLLWLAKTAAEVHHHPLGGDLHGLCKRRVGSYRILYEVLREQRILMVHRIGDRRDIYE